jgi:O-phosphoseryl-tRNA(Cys) synthetase
MEHFLTKRYCQNIHEKPARKMSIDRCLQRENMEKDKEVWEMKKTFFISA